MKKINEKYYDYNTIHQRITDDKQEKTLISAEYGVENGVNVANFAPYTNLSVLRNHDEVADAIQHLKSNFGKKASPVPLRAQVSDASNQAPPPGLPPTFVLSRPEDEEKTKKNQAFFNRLRIFLMGTANELDVTKVDSEIIPVAVELAPEFEEIVMSKSSEGTKAEELQGLVEASFADDQLVANLSRAKSAVSAAKSLICMPKAAAAKLQTQPVIDLIQDTATFGPLNLLYQDNTGNKADLLKHQENIYDVEETQNVPDSQRSSRKATLMSLVA